MSTPRDMDVEARLDDPVDPRHRPRPEFEVGDGPIGLWGQRASWRVIFLILAGAVSVIGAALGALAYGAFPW